MNVNVVQNPVPHVRIFIVLGVANGSPRHLFRAPGQGPGWSGKLSAGMGRGGFSNFEWVPASAGTKYALADAVHWQQVESGLE